VVALEAALEAGGGGGGSASKCACLSCCPRTLPHRCPRPAPQGQGRYVEDSGDTFDGEWRDGLRHGRGRATYGGRPGDGVGADVYEGCWEANMRCARGEPAAGRPAAQPSGMLRRRL
jgi:hypothetical protein